MATENTLDLFRDDLKEFFDFDENLDLLSSSEKYDGIPRHVYLTDIKQEYLTLAPDDNSVIIKELTYEQALIYHKISQTFHPHLESVYCVLEREGHFISISEFIKAPDCLNCEQRSISLEEAMTQFGCFSERDALIYLCQLCEGIETLHKMHLTHNDISPKNILLTNAPAWQKEISIIPPASQNIWVKLIDFDISREQKKWNHDVTTIMGTTPYAAPEILDFRYPTNRVDIYSLGCILYYMLTGESPKNTSIHTHQRQFSKNTLRIINKCTAHYEKRYKNVSQLKKDALCAVMTLNRHVPRWVGCLPGFRSHRYWKMAIASCYYQFILIAIVASTVGETLLSFLPYLLMMIVPLFILFDLLPFAGKFPKYANWKIAHPRLVTLFKIIIIQFDFVLFWKLLLSSLE